MTGFGIALYEILKLPPSKRKYAILIIINLIPIVMAVGLTIILLYNIERSYYKLLAYTSILLIWLISSIIFYEEYKTYKKYKKEN